MKFVYKNCKLPDEPALMQQLEHAAAQLEEKMRKLDYKALPISDYAKRYYAYDLRKLQYMLQSYCYLILWSVHERGKPLDEISLLDHGGGIGMLSLLAKSAGAKTVIYQDINAEVANDAKIISSALQISIDEFVIGDTKDFVKQLIEKKLNVDIFGSRNVIEHVHDLNDFFAEMKNIPSEKLVLFLSTSANIHNPAMRIYTRKYQRMAELKGARTEWGGNKLDESKALWKVRRNILKENFPQLNENELNKLATASRGFMVEGIKKITEKYLLDKKFPAPIADPCNTCDPFNGNWAEHLVPLREYKNICEANGFQFSSLNGFYNTHYNKPYLNPAMKILNSLIKLFGKNGIVLAPFISICAVRKK